MLPAAVAMSLLPDHSGAPRTIDSLRDAALAALASARDAGGGAARVLTHLRPLQPGLRQLALQAAAADAVPACASSGLPQATSAPPCPPDAEASPPAEGAGADSPAAQPALNPSAPCAANWGRLPEESALFGEPLAVEKTPVDPPEQPHPLPVLADSTASQPQEHACAAVEAAGPPDDPQTEVGSKQSPTADFIVRTCAAKRSALLRMLRGPPDSGEDAAQEGAACSPRSRLPPDDGDAAAHVLSEDDVQRLAASVAHIVRSTRSSSAPPTATGSSVLGGGVPSNGVAAAHVCAIVRQTLGEKCVHSGPWGTPGGPDSTPDTGNAASVVAAVLSRLRVPHDATEPTLIDLVMPELPAASTAPLAVAVAAAQSGHLAEIAAASVSPARPAHSTSEERCVAAVVAFLSGDIQAGAVDVGRLPGSAAWWCAACAVEQSTRGGHACGVHALGCVRAGLCAAALHCADAIAQRAMLMPRQRTHEVDAFTGRPSGPAGGSVVTAALVGRLFQAALQHTWAALRECDESERSALLSTLLPGAFCDEVGGRGSEAGPLPMLRAVLRDARQAPALSAALAAVANTLTLEQAAPGQQLQGGALVAGPEWEARAAAAIASALAPAAAVAGVAAVSAHIWRLAAAQPLHAHCWAAACGALAAPQTGAAVDAAAAWAAGVRRDAATGRLEADASRRAATLTAAAICAAPALVPLGDFVSISLLPLLEATSAGPPGALLGILGCLNAAVTGAAGPEGFCTSVGDPIAVRTACAAARCAAGRWGWYRATGHAPASGQVEPQMLRAQADGAALAETLLSALLTRPPPTPHTAAAAASEVLAARAGRSSACCVHEAAVLAPLCRHMHAHVLRAALRSGDRSIARQLLRVARDLEELERRCLSVHQVLSSVRGGHSTAQHTAVSVSHAPHLHIIADFLITSSLTQTPPPVGRPLKQHSSATATGHIPQHAAAAHAINSPRLAQGPTEFGSILPSKESDDAGSTPVSAADQGDRLHSAAHSALQQLPQQAHAAAAEQLTCVVSLLLPEYPADKPQHLLDALIELRRVLCCAGREPDGTSTQIASMLGFDARFCAETRAVAVTGAAILRLASRSAGLSPCVAALCAGPPSQRDQEKRPAGAVGADDADTGHTWAHAWVAHADGNAGSAAITAAARVLCALCLHVAEGGGSAAQRAVQSDATDSAHTTLVRDSSGDGDGAAAWRAVAARLLRSASVAQQLCGTVCALTAQAGSARADLGGVRAVFLKLLDAAAGDAAQLRAALAPNRAPVGQPLVSGAAGGGGEDGGDACGSHGVGGLDRGAVWCVCERACVGVADSLRTLPAEVSGDLEGLLEDLVADWRA